MKLIEVNRDGKKFFFLGHWDALEDFYTMLGKNLKGVRTIWISSVNLDVCYPLSDDVWKTQNIFLRTFT